jgi:ADP-ribose pyrophosphatase YjhB (NUDIX family)
LHPDDRSGREYPRRPVVGVGAVVFVAAADRQRIGLEPPGPDPGVVLIRRRFEPLAGEWSLPGGTVAVGETLHAAVAREVHEETGLVVDVGNVIEVFDRIMVDGSQRVQYHFVLIDYLCRPVGGTLMHGSDAADAVVADPLNLDSFRLTEKTRTVIATGLSLRSVI